MAFVRSKPLVRRALVAAPLLALAAACGGNQVDATPPLSTASAPSSSSTAPPPVDAEAFRATPPGPEGEVTFVPPRIEEAKLANGLRVLVVTRRELPIVDVRLAFARGADQAKPGVAAFAAALLTQGTKKRSSLGMSDALQDLGASLSAFATYDSTQLAGRALATKLPALVELLAEAAQSPAFDKAEVERERASRLTTLQQQNDQPGTLLWNTTIATLYPAGHPYAAPTLGEQADVKRIQPAELAKFHADHLGPENAVLAFAGDLSLADAKALAERTFGGWKKKLKPRVEVPEVPARAATDTRVVLFERTGTTQSQVGVVRIGVPRRSPDYEKLVIANTILGGQFSSRLNLNLREKHAYTYGAGSSFDMRLGAGPFRAGGAIQKEHTVAAVKEIVAELARMQAEPVTADELASAQQYLIRQLPAWFETGSDTASTLTSMGVFGLPLDEFAKRPERLAAVTAADVQRVAKERLAEAGRVLVVVGDPSLAGPLGELGLGPVTVKKAPAKPDPAPAAAPSEHGKGAPSAPAAPAKPAKPTKPK